MNPILKSFDKKTVFLFPGQGSQKVGMGKDLLLKSKSAKIIFEQMDSVLGIKLSEIMMNGDNEILSKSEYSQPAILACSYAMFKTFQENTGFKFEDYKDYENQFITLGHSLGEFSALTVSNMIEFEDAIEIVHKRGKAMQECIKEGKETSMIALIGDIEINLLVNTIETNKLNENEELVEIANINSPQQIVLSGYKHSIFKLIDFLKQKKLKFKSIPLNVQLPFHCRLLNPVCDILRQILNEKDEKWKFLNPSVPIIMNLDCNLYRDVHFIKENLIIQTTKTVDFSGCLKECEKLDFTNFVEVGYGSTLSSLVQRNLNNVEVSHIEKLLL